MVSTSCAIYNKLEIKCIEIVDSIENREVLSMVVDEVTKV